MKAQLLALLAETPLHPGIGHDDSDTDLPVSREAITSAPRIPSSSVKGALRERAWQQAFAAALADPKKKDDAEAIADHHAKHLFGDSEEAYGAAHLAPSDAGLLLLPVRSLDMPYRWVTCNWLIERHCRLCALATAQAPQWQPLPIGEGQVVVGHGSGTVFLEDLDFEVLDLESREQIDALICYLKPMLGHAATQNRLADQFAVVNDAAFDALTARALPVSARNKLDRRKVSEQLFHEETLPPDTLLCTLIAETRPGGFAHLDHLLRNDHPYLRFGGNETLFQGWCRVTRLQSNAGSQIDQGATE